jgi:hypothetical protein
MLPRRFVTQFLVFSFAFFSPHRHVFSPVKAALRC